MSFFIFIATINGMSTSLYLIRHGQTNVNQQADTLVSGLYPDAYLSEEGQRQARQLGTYLHENNFEFEKVYCSSIHRAKQTLEAVQENYSLDTDPIYDYALRERSTGEWEGHTKEEIYTRETLQAIADQGSWYTSPGGESYQDLILRAANWFHQELLPLPTSDSPDRNILLISHSLFIRALLQYVFQYETQYLRKLKIANTSLTKLTLSAKGITCEYVNATPHLTAPDITQD